MQPYERYTKPTFDYGVKGVGLNACISEYDAICMLAKQGGLTNESKKTY